MPAPHGHSATTRLCGSVATGLRPSPGHCPSPGPRRRRPPSIHSPLEWSRGRVDGPPATYPPHIRGRHPRGAQPANRRAPMRAANVRLRRQPAPPSCIHWVNARRPIPTRPLRDERRHLGSRRGTGVGATIHPTGPTGPFVRRIFATRGRAPAGEPRFCVTVRPLRNGALDRVRPHRTVAAAPVDGAPTVRSPARPPARPARAAETTRSRRRGARIRRWHGASGRADPDQAGDPPGVGDGLSKRSGTTIRTTKVRSTPPECPVTSQQPGVEKMIPLAWCPVVP